MSSIPFRPTPGFPFKTVENKFGKWVCCLHAARCKLKTAPSQKRIPGGVHDLLEWRLIVAIATEAAA
jgi:hypothetical protein